MTNVVQYKSSSADTARGPSPAIWGDCPWLEIMAQVAQGRGGYQLWDDFDTGGLITSPTTIAALGGGHKYSGFGSSGATITVDDAAAGSSGIVLTEATNNEAVSITTDNHPYTMSNVSGNLWFEARVKTSTITTAEQSFFIGLTETEPHTAAIPLTATDVLSDHNMVGFHMQEATTTAFDFSYKANGITAVEVNADIGTLAVDTYVKLGFVLRSTDRKIRCFINGVEQASTKTLDDADGTDFPSDVGLAPTLAMLLGNSAAETMTMDWWKVAQIPEDN